MAPRKGRGGGGGGGAVRKAANGHRLPARLPLGLTLTDVSQRRWRLGPSIGVGGFGEIYCADEDAGGAVGADAAYVVKVEPHSNGPLFSEMHCYHRVGRTETIAAWIRQRRLKRLGMPRFVGSGSVEFDGERYRFMVIDRFGADLQKLLNQNGGRFPPATVLLVGLQVLDTLEYIHSREYIHADIKAQNILLGYKKGTENQVYLVDFGLACRYALSGRHKPYRPDLRKAHDGTIEFTSRDAHIGAHSRRGDLEILGYNLLQWASGRLPWQDNLQHADYVARQKAGFMQNVPALMRACFPDGVPAGVNAVQHYLEAVAELGFDTEPDYDALRGLLRSGLRALGSPSQLQFSGTAQAVAALRGPARRTSGRTSSAAVPTPARRRRRRPPSGGRRPSAAERAARSTSARSGSSGGGQENWLGRARSPPGRRGRAPLRLVTENGVPAGEPPLATSPSLRSDGKLRDFDWQHFNKVVEQTHRRRVGTSRPATCDGGGDGGSGSGSGGDDVADTSYTVYDNITPAMRAVILKRLARSPEKSEPRSKKRCRSVSRSRKRCSTSAPVTPAMAHVLSIREKRLSSGRRLRSGLQYSPNPA